MSYSRNGKTMHALYCNSVRKLVDGANELKLPREDVIAILKEREQYVLIYYYGTTNANEK